MGEIAEGLLKIHEEEREYWFGNLAEMAILVGAEDDIFVTVQYISRCLLV